MGKRVRLINMPNDPHPVPVGTEGTIDHIDGAGHIHVKWDNGSSLSLIPGVDKWEILEEIAAFGTQIAKSLVGKKIIFNETEGVIESIGTTGDIHVRMADNNESLSLKPGIEKYEIIFADEDLSKYMGNKGETFIVDKAGSGENTKYYLIRASSPHHMVDLLFNSPEEATKYAGKRGLIIKNKMEEQYAAGDGAEIVSENDVLKYLNEKYGVDPENLRVGKGKNGKWNIYVVDIESFDAKFNPDRKGLICSTTIVKFDKITNQWEKDVNDKFTKGKVVYKTIAFNANKKVSYYNGELSFQNIKDLTGITPVKIEHIKYLEIGKVDPFIKWSAEELKNKFGHDIENIIVAKKDLPDGEVEITEAFAVTDDEKYNFKYSPLIHEWWSAEERYFNGGGIKEHDVKEIKEFYLPGKLYKHKKLGYIAKYIGRGGHKNKHTYYVVDKGNSEFKVGDQFTPNEPQKWFDVVDQTEILFSEGGQVELKDSHTLNSFHDWLRFDSPEAESHDKALDILHYSQFGENRYLERVFPRYKDQFYAYLEKNPHAFYADGGPVKESQITLDDGTVFYIDQLPEGIVKTTRPGRYSEHQLVAKGVNIFFLKNVVDDESALNIAATELEDTKQPTEKDVRRAMLLKIGYEGFWYALKAGGETASDHMYSSSLSMDMEGPNGEDVEKVIIKKHNTDFEKVLITGAEIREIKRKILKFKRSVKMREDEVQGLIDFLISAQAKGKYETSSKGKSTGFEDYNEVFKERIIEKILDLGNEKVIKEAVKFRIDQHQHHLEWMGDQECVYMIDEKYMTPAKCKEETQKEKDKAHKLIGLLNTLEGELITKLQESPMAAANGRRIGRHIGNYEFTSTDGYEVEYETDGDYPIISGVTIGGEVMDLEILTEDEIGKLSEEAWQDYINKLIDQAEYSREDFAKDGATIGQEAPDDNKGPKPSAAKIVVFKHKRNPHIIITVKAYPNMSISEIDNPSKVHFPYFVGQVLNMGHQTWACNNNYFVNDEDTCPEEKVFGIKVSDIPAGHPLRHIYPGKFRANGGTASEVEMRRGGPINNLTATAGRDKFIEIEKLIMDKIDAQGGGHIKAKIITIDKSMDTIQRYSKASGGNSVLQMMHGKKRYGRMLYSVISNDNVLVGIQFYDEAKNKAYADDLELAQKYMQKNRHPNLWDDLGKDYAFTQKQLEDFRTNTAGLSHYDAWQKARTYGLPQIEGHKTITMQSAGMPGYAQQQLKDAIDQKKDYRYSWDCGYDCSVSTSTGTDGIYRGWFSQEYRDTGNGHYWILISPTQAIFAEND
jgi:hypothetical protein